MNITAIALNKQQLALVIIAASLLSGILAFLSIPQAQDPGFPIRTAQVITYFPGARPNGSRNLSPIN